MEGGCLAILKIGEGGWQCNDRPTPTVFGLNNLMYM